MERAIPRTFESLRREKRKAFIPFLTAGDPDLESTVRLVEELARSGSHIVELGIPFSDPLADGPTIQRSSGRALRHGYRLADFLEAVRQIRRRTPVPLVLFSYLNPLFQYGLENLARDARSAGVDGVLVTDMTPEEGEEYCGHMERYGLDPVFLVAPTSDAGRIARIAECSRGFIYVVSRTGVTGAREEISDALLPTVRRVRENCSLPVAVGFGISRPDQVSTVWEFAEGAVVGSAIVSEIERNAGSNDLVERIGAFCRWLTGGGNAVRKS